MGVYDNIIAKRDMNWHLDDRHAEKIANKAVFKDNTIDLFKDQDLENLEDSLINTAANLSKVSTQHIVDLMDIIGWHESDRTMDPGLIHYQNPGRGLHGYEIASSKEYPKASNSGRTAMNRLYAMIGGKIATEDSPDHVIPKKMPEFMKRYFNKEGYPAGEVDVSILTAQEQRVLFLADHIRAGSFMMEEDGGKLLNEGKFIDWWATQHHKGENPNTEVFNENWILWEKQNR